MPEQVLVCTACGSPACVSGEILCADFLRSDVVRCSCDWDDDLLSWMPVVVDPGCDVHGEPS